MLIQTKNNLWLKWLVLAGVFALAMPFVTEAHVKWFADFSFLDEPLSFFETLTPNVIGLTIAAVIAMPITVWLDKFLEDYDAYKSIKAWLYERRDESTLILRIGMGVTFLLSWQADTLLAPYLRTEPIFGWVQFVLVLLLLFPRTTPIAGAGTILLWFVGIFQFGVFYMLDYLAFIGIGTWLLLSQAKTQRVRELGIPALYFTVGFALSWLAMEKLVYPDWGLEILAANPQLTLGFPPEFFATAAAFVEFTLGYLLIIGLLGRPLSLVITLVFFTTTLVFGKVEVIGHTHLHTALLVFLLHGPGNAYPAPIDIHQKISWRMAFAAVNYVVLLVVFLALFSVGARLTFEQEVRENISPLNIAACENLGAGGTIRINQEDVPCELILEQAAQMADESE
ncbi:MAG: DoxX family membrane protein [Chloroflexota bacterium]